MKLSTLVLLFLLALCQWQVSAKPSKEFAEEMADEMDSLQEEWNLDDIQFEEGELEDFINEMNDAVEAGTNPNQVLQQRQAIIQKITQLQQRLQSLVYSPGFQGGQFGGGQFGGGQFGAGQLGGMSNQQLQQLLQQLQGGAGGKIKTGKNQFQGFGGNQFQGFGGNPYDPYGLNGPNGFNGLNGNSKQYTALMKQLSKGQGGNNQWQFLLQDPQLLQQDPQLLYFLEQQGGGGKSSFKLPKAPRTQQASGPQMCWCPCQQANEPTQHFGGPPTQHFGGSYGGFGVSSPGLVGFNSDPFGFNSDPYGLNSDPYGLNSGFATHTVDPFGNVQDPFGNTVGNVNGFGFGAAPVGIGATHTVDPFGNVQDPFGNTVGNVNGGFATFEEVESSENEIVVPRE